MKESLGDLRQPLYVSTKEKNRSADISKKFAKLKPLALKHLASQVFLASQ